MEKLISTRTDSIKDLFDVNYRDEPTFLTKTKLPTGQLIIGRMLSLCKPGRKGGAKIISRKDASVIVAEEVKEDWISKNVYPMGVRSIAIRIQNDYEKFREFRKTERHQGKPKTEQWITKAREFNEQMCNRAFDVRCQNKTFQKQLETEYGVVMNSEDVAFYEDNCHGLFIATCSQTVPRKWRKQKCRNEARQINAEIQRMDMQKEQYTEETLCMNQVRNALKDITDDNISDPDFGYPVDNCFNIDASIPITRSNKKDPVATENIYAHSFPSVKIRTGHKTLNEALIWSELSSDEESDACESPKPKRRRCGDLTYVMPSRKCLSKYLEDAHYLNLEMLAEYLLNKADSVVTVGIDDATKAAGHDMLHGDHITIAGPTQTRKTFTTGYVENISHSGQDSAPAYEFKLETLATLANTSVEDIKNNIDFWEICRRTLQKRKLEKVN
ncbi:hypothetical protein LOTGIDRAFT_172448 [Lottia gigantea]|uniref:Uncharacterized protein n=1 Tax=Lottia gigantea TaxID=225164 RepID=V4CHS8_LOTGI|nr:hypothetical protein LOTGIDRAFT_172448 [Lottia gigantea]ESP01695.1 hypothetical protein LOTGIDRAFT_172448 [Lottia gigantea]